MTADVDLQEEEERREIENLIQQVRDSLQQEEGNVSDQTAPDEDWLEGTNARQPHVSRPSHLGT